MANCIILTGGTWNKDDWSKIQRSVGPYRLSTSLEQEGYSTFVFDYIINFNFEEIKQVLSKHLTDETLWIGFSSTFFWFPEHGKTSGNGDILKLKEMYWTYDNEIQQIMDYIKANSKAKIVYGGTKSEFFLGKDKNIDYYIGGLADNSIVSFTNYLKTGDESLLLHCEEVADYDGKKCYFIDSTKYPEPKMHEIRTNWWNPKHNVIPGEGLPIELARGCIFKCKFCTYPLLGKKKGTYLRDAQEIKDDLIRNYESHGTTDYFLTDDTVNDDVDKLESLHKVFTSLPFKPTFTGFFRLDLINSKPATADLLAEMGVIGVFFGIETLNHGSAKSIGKGLHPNKVKDRLYWLKEKWNKKVNIGGGIILGLPHDTTDYFEELIDWHLQPDCPMDHVQFYPLHLNDRSKEKRKGLYVSEFNLHPEVYGYEFPGKNNIMYWELPEQQLSYIFVNEISKQFNRRRDHMNKIAGFEMTRYKNVGVSLDDLYDLTHLQIKEKYDLDAMNNLKINEYKKLLGL